MNRIHLAGISQDPKFISRLQTIASEFEFNAMFFKTSDEFNENIDQTSQVAVTIFSVIEVENASEIAGHVQVLKYSAPDSYITLIVNKKISADNIAFIKKSGVDLILQESDFFETSFVEYALSQIIRGSIIPMKAHDLTANSVIDFKVLSMMPLNKKILPVLQPNSVVTEQKLQKIKGTKEVYVSRDDLQKVQNYCDKNKVLSAEGISSRCRLKYLDLCKAHSELIFSLFDRSDRVTFSNGKSLLEKCSQIASDMLMNLSTLADPWSIINNSTIGETGSVERLPAIASMAGLMTLNLKNIKTEDTIVAGLLCDLGMLMLHPQILLKIRQNRFNELTEAELKQYQSHPQLSIDKCLEKKLPLTDKIKSIIICTHETQNGAGFPNNPNPSQISKESQLLQYCEFIDQKLVIKMGKKNEDVFAIQSEFIEKELESKKILDISIAVELKKYLSLIQTIEKAS